MLGSVVASREFTLLSNFLLINGGFLCKDACLWCSQPLKDNFQVLSPCCHLWCFANAETGCIPCASFPTYRYVSSIIWYSFILYESFSLHPVNIYLFQLLNASVFIIIQCWLHSSAMLCCQIHVNSSILWCTLPINGFVWLIWVPSENKHFPLCSCVLPWTRCFVVSICFAWHVILY